MKHWLRYIEFKKDAPKTTINLIYERALKELPGRYHNLLILIKKKKIITLKEDICKMLLIFRNLTVLVFILKFLFILLLNF